MSERTNEASALVRKLWQYCNILRDDGLSYPDYVEQLTYLLFLKMADEGGVVELPRGFGWSSLVALGAKEMHHQYGRILSHLGERSGLLGLIFHSAKNKIRDPAKLRLLIVELIGQTEWSGLPADLKGDAYEGLLEKNARDTKSGAGQYFTPRPLIEAIVDCIRPQLGEVVCDPACGTGGFLLGAHRYLRLNNPKLTRSQRSHLQKRALRGVELVEEVARLAAMNLLLHGVVGEADDELPIECADSLKALSRVRPDVVLANPPFGVKGSITYSGGGRRGKTSDELTIVRPDFWVATANKQLNFVQHIASQLRVGGRAAVIVPDNVLFESGAAAVIRRKLMENSDVHTLLRLPPGLFYAQGVKANVLFFDKRDEEHQRTGRHLWVYDLRSETRFTLRTRPLKKGDLAEFITLYRATDRGNRRVSDGKRWRRFDVREIQLDTDARFDLAWSMSPSTAGDGALSRLEEVSKQLSQELRAALESIERATRR